MVAATHKSHTAKDNAHKGQNVDEALSVNSDYLPGEFYCLQLETTTKEIQRVVLSRMASIVLSVRSGSYKLHKFKKNTTIKMLPNHE